MAIQISDVTVIDDSRNISNVGIITATSFSGDGSGLSGVGVGTEDNINTTGIITASTISANEFIGTGDKLIFSPTITSFSPTDGATDVAVDANIVLTFDQQVYPGVGTIFLRNSSGIGTEIQAIGINSSSVTFSNQTVTINPSSDLPEGTDVYVVIPEGVITNAVAGVALSLTTYNFTTREFLPGDAYGGGYLICQASSVRWVVAPSSTEVSRDWYCRDDAVTTAQASAACGDWFVPSCGQLKNPGYTCRTHWDSYSTVQYWSNTASGTGGAWAVNLANGSAGPSGIPKTCSNCVRAFRCVSY